MTTELRICLGKHYKTRGGLIITIFAKSTTSDHGIECLGSPFCKVFNGTGKWDENGRYLGDCSKLDLLHEVDIKSQ